MADRIGFSLAFLSKPKSIELLLPSGASQVMGGELVFSEAVEAIRVFSFTDCFIAHTSAATQIVGTGQNTDRVFIPSGYVLEMAWFGRGLYAVSTIQSSAGYLMISGF